MRVCVFCASATSIAPEHVAFAGDVGRAIAGRGWDLVTGGGSHSMMGAVAAAVRAGGRHTLGVIPGELVGFEGADVGSDELVTTAGMRERKAVMDSRADAFLTLPGGIGTLEELLEVWTSRSLGLHAKPVVVCDPTGVYAPLRSLVEGLAGAGFVRPAGLAALTWTTDIDAALDACAA